MNLKKLKIEEIRKKSMSFLEENCDLIRSVTVVDKYGQTKTICAIEMFGNKSIETKKTF